MKQINECLDRFFNGETPLKRKWQARWHKDHENVMILFHYQHIILIYNVATKQVLHQWWEVPTDKRGLDAALEYLQKK